MKKFFISFLILLIANVTFADSFSSYIASLKQQARDQGFSEHVIHQAFNSVQELSLSRYHDKHQTQKVETFDQYLQKAVTPTRIELGKHKMHLYRSYLKTISKHYQVPKQYIAALWGLETNYGQITGDFPEFSALTTLAYHSSRKSLFTREIWAALKMLQQKKVEIKNMKGSWAGAMGQCQFMPTAYLLYAVRYTNNGAPDIWATEPDVFASMANYLQQEGWNNHYSLLFEVNLTRPIASHLIGLNTQKSMHYWLHKGIVAKNDENLSTQRGNYSLLLPQGMKGPAYLVNWNNFRVIMRWNYSTFYAISVGVLANKLAS